MSAGHDALPEGAEELRALFLEGQAAAEPKPGCPTPEEIFDFARGAWQPLQSRPGGNEGALALADHCLACACASCSLALRLAREIQAQLGDELEPARPRPQPGPSLRRQILAGVATLAACAAILFVVQRPKAPIYRADPIELVSQVREPALPRDQFALRWAPLAVGTRYSVNVATPDLNVLFARGGLTEAQAQVPKTALEKLPAGAQVVWRVTALLADGRRIESTAFITAVQ